MASLFCGDLSFVERQIAKHHLSWCWHCRVLQEDLEGPRADEVVEIYRADLNSNDLLLSPKPRLGFVRSLESLKPDNLTRTKWSMKISQTGRFPGLSIHSIFLAFSLIFVISICLWWPRRAPSIAPNVLLANAQRVESLSRIDSPLVLYQKISIKTEQREVQRSIYSDLQGRRYLKHVELSGREKSLRGDLTRAGVDWDTPISASGYQAWRDRQPLRADEIVRTGTHLLRLTTKVPNGVVVEESLTVRDTDFHAVRRTVAFRGRGTIDIAELDFKILPWSAIDLNIFEPVDRSPSLIATNPFPTVQMLHIPKSVSPVQLDEAELEARLILNQLHADAGEQIEIHRVSEGIEVQGIVETDERKRELQRRLRMVPHLTVSVQSVTDLKNKGDVGGGTEIRIASMGTQQSPLEKYLQAQGRGLSDSNGLAQQIFNASLVVSQECKAIVDLQTQFRPGEQRSVLVSATLSDLIYSHRERLHSALKHERQLIATAGISPTPGPAAVSPKLLALQVTADKNLALSRELTQASEPTPRSAEEIFVDMSISIDEITTASREVYGKTEGVIASNGKK